LTKFINIFIKMEGVAQMHEHSRMHGLLTLARLVTLVGDIAYNRKNSGNARLKSHAAGLCC
jgi:hypothetical protein